MFEALVLNGFTLLCLPWLLLTRFSSSDTKRILVIQLGKIGDMVCTTPLLRSLRTAHPHAHITVLCIGRAGEILKNNPCIDEVLVADDAKFLGVMGRIKLLLLLHAQRFGMSIAVLPGTWNAMLGLWTSAPVRVHTRGGRMGIFGLFLHRFHTHRLNYARGTRTYDHYMKIAAAVGASVVPYKHEVFLSQEEIASADTWLHQHEVNGVFAMFSITAGNRLKEWPVERFLELAKHLITTYNIPVLFSSSDTARTAEAVTMLESPLGIDAGGLSLRQLSAVIARASLFVSVDTGPLYIAHAFDVLLVAIVGPVDPAEQPPVPDEKVALVLPPGIKPSSFVAETLRVSTAEQQKAIDVITVDMVKEAVEQIWKG